MLGKRFAFSLVSDRKQGLISGYTARRQRLELEDAPAVLQKDGSGGAADVLAIIPRRRRSGRIDLQCLPWTFRPGSGAYTDRRGDIPFNMMI